MYTILGVTVGSSKKCKKTKKTNNVPVVGSSQATLSRPCLIAINIIHLPLLTSQRGWTL
jgi:hypothetical protein